MLRYIADSQSDLTLKDWLPTIATILSVAALIYVTRESNKNALKIARQTGLLALHDQFEVELRQVISELTTGIPNYLSAAAHYTFVRDVLEDLDKVKEARWSLVHQHRQMHALNAKLRLFIKQVYNDSDDGKRARKLFEDIRRMIEKYSFTQMEKIPHSKFSIKDERYNQLVTELQDVYVVICNDARTRILNQ